MSFAKVMVMVAVFVAVSLFLVQDSLALGIAPAMESMNLSTGTVKR
jgi:hypothetical protein